MFGKHREKKEREAAEAAAASWQAQHDAFAQLLDLAANYHGEATSELVLKRGEALYAKVDGASLIEDRAGRGQWQGRSQGFSIPVASIGGRSIRYHVGATKGHYVQGTPVPTAIDHGTLFLTNQRVVFRGMKQNRECRFDKLLSAEHLDTGESIFAVSNRQKNTVVHYGPELDVWFQIRYAIAFADFQGTRDAIVTEARTHLAELDQHRPALPAAPPGVPPPPTMDAQPAQWAHDPTARHEQRYWDGTKWTGYVADHGAESTDPL